MSDHLGIFSGEELRTARELVRALARAVRGHRLYGGEHPNYLGMLDHLRSKWRAATGGGPLPLRMTERQVLMEQEVLYQGSGAGEVLPSLLYDHGVVGLVFLPDIQREEARRLTAALAQDPHPSIDYAALLWEADLKHLKVLLDADEFPEDSITSPEDFAAGLVELVDADDPPAAPQFERERAELDALEEAEADADRFGLTEAEQRRVGLLVREDTQRNTVRHAMRVVHALARESLTLAESLTLERATSDLVTAATREGDLDGAIEMLGRVDRMRGSDRDLELQVAELTLAVFLEPDNLRTLLDGLDLRETLDPRALGDLFALLSPTAAPVAAEWLLDTKHPAVAAQAIAVYGDDALSALVPAYTAGGPRERDRVGPALLAIGTPEALRALASDFARLSEKSRLRLLHVCARSTDGEAREVVVQALTDRSERVRRAAMNAMRKGDADGVAARLRVMFLEDHFSKRSATELTEFFEMLSRIGDAAVADLLAAQCLPRGLKIAMRRLTPLQEHCLRALRRMRSPEGRKIADELRTRGPRVVRRFLDDPLADL